VEIERRTQLLGVALRALVADRTGDHVDAEPQVMGRGVALSHARSAWVLIDQQHATALGPAMAWALRHEASALHVFTGEAEGILARRASGFRPDALAVDVWRVNDRHQTPAVPEPLPGALTPLAEHLALQSLIAEAGAEVVVEHGVVSGEVAGLEVCRVVTDPFTEVVRVEVGVGVHDREAFALLHGGLPVVEALAGVVASVAQHRRVDAPLHPLNRLARERLLRHRLMAHPHLIGLEVLNAAEPPLARHNVKDAVPCAGVGRDTGGQPVVVVCCTGIDLDVVPWALDARLAHHPDAAVVVAVEARDAHPMQRRLAACARGEVRIAALNDSR
jgi:hypothetical protein